MKKQPSLLLCVILDIIGCGFYIFPVVGEAFDIVWAPVSAIVFLILFGRKSAFGAVFSMVEEVIPGVDIIPTFTIAWVVRYLANRTKKPVILKPQQSRVRLVG